LFVRKSEECSSQDIDSLFGSFKYGIKNTWLIDEKTDFDNQKLQFALRHLVIEPGKLYPMHPRERMEVTYVLEGEGHIEAEKKEFIIKTGDLMVTGIGEDYSITNSGEMDLELLAFTDLRPQQAKSGK
jgi:mannose-6-phosphate isomerase-like protein (cupin superfamily)